MPVDAAAEMIAIRFRPDWNASISWALIREAATPARRFRYSAEPSWPRTMRFARPVISATLEGPK